MSAEGILFVCMNYAPELTGCGKYTGDLGAELARREQGVTVVTTPPHYPGWAAQAPYSNRYRIERTGDDDGRALPSDHAIENVGCLAGHRSLVVRAIGGAGHSLACDPKTADDDPSGGADLVSRADHLGRR